MLPTLIGLIVFFTGFVILLTRRMQPLLIFTMVCTLMSGSAAFILVALGSSSIPPSMLAMGFLMLRGFQKEPGRESQISAALKANVFFIMFAIYSIISAILLPRVFFHKISVVPLKPLGLRNLFDVFPLEPSSQNLTSAFNITGSVIICIFTYIAVSRRMGAVYFVRGALTVIFLHATFGILNAAAPSAIWTPISAVFRTASYAAVDQSIGQIIRINGIMTEPSAYAEFGLCWLVLITELWLRDVMPRATGVAALLMGIVLTASTSSTAYIGLSLYLVVLVVRMILVPEFFRFDKGFALGVFALFITVAVSLLMMLKPAIVDGMVSIFQQMTIDKADSMSGKQRAFWAKQGLSAFTTSYGLGIGVGSFRSSSILTAIIGSVGVIGSTAFLLHLLSVFQPSRGTTFGPIEDRVEAVGVAAAWGALFAFIFASLGASSPDPGPVFAIFGGTALALRGRKQGSPAGTLSAASGAPRVAIA